VGGRWKVSWLAEAPAESSGSRFYGLGVMEAWPNGQSETLRGPANPRGDGGIKESAKVRGRRVVDPSRLRSRERAFDKDAPRTPAPPSEWFVRKRTAASKAK
jgi:hypothetical protein